VSTNSIAQGEQAGILWSYLFSAYGVKIHFAHRTFSWSSEARGMAHVHVVIIGFGVHDTDGKHIYDHSDETQIKVLNVRNISPYLVEGSDVAIPNRTTPICDVPKMSWGNKPTDGGHLLLSPEEKRELLKAEPQVEPFIRRYMGGGDFLNGLERYCLWLVGADPVAIRTCHRVMERVERVKQFRAASKAQSTRHYANQPTLFRQISQPASSYLAVPEVSSEARMYIPMAYFGPDVICSNTVQFVPDATLYHFGVLSSSMHMDWMRTVAGRLESRYRYSNTLVYNNFPWPSPSVGQSKAVEAAAQAVLDARAEHSKATLADLYDPLTMPPNLAKAHATLDAAVDRCYRSEPFVTERERVEYLFALYEKITLPLATGKPAKKPRKKKALTNEKETKGGS
jgi:hypothetical protein